MGLFLLVGYEHVHKDKARQYEAICSDIDKKMQETEPGVLLHAKERVSEEDSKVVYRWLEVFRDYEDFQFHLNNPALVELGERMQQEDVKCAPIDVIAYADWTDEQKAPLLDLAIEGIFTIKFAPLVSAFSRSL